MDEKIGFDEVSAAPGGEAFVPLLAELRDALCGRDEEPSSSSEDDSPVERAFAPLSTMFEAEEELAHVERSVRPLAAALAAPANGAQELELAAPLAAALVDLAGVAVGASREDKALRLLDLATLLAVGDPHDHLLDLQGPRDPAAARTARAEVAAALSLRAALVAELCDGAPPRGSEGEAGVEPRRRRARAARLLASFLPAVELPEGIAEALACEGRAWWRAAEILWGPSRDGDELAGIALDRDEEPLVGAAAAIAATSAAVARGATPDPALARRLGALVDQRAHNWGASWAPAGLFSELGSPSAPALLGPAAARRFEVEPIARGLLVVLEALPDRRSQRASLASCLLRFALGHRLGPWPFQFFPERAVPDPAELSSLERAVLEAVCREVSAFQWDFAVHHALHGLGLPPRWIGARRFVGLDPPGPMESRIRVRGGDGTEAATPLGLACRRFLDGELSMEELAAAMARDLSPERLAYVATRGLSPFDYHLVDSGDEALGSRESERRLLQLRVASLEAAGPAAIDPLLELASRDLDDLSHQLLGNEVTLVALSRLMERAGQPLPEWLDLLIPGLMGVNEWSGLTEADVREVLRRLPEPRRSAVILSQLGSFRWREDAPTFTDLLDPGLEGEVLALMPGASVPGTSWAGQAAREVVESLVDEIGLPRPGSKKPPD